MEKVKYTLSEEDAMVLDKATCAMVRVVDIFIRKEQLTEEDVTYFSALSVGLVIITAKLREQARGTEGSNVIPIK